MAKDKKDEQQEVHEEDQNEQPQGTEEQAEQTDAPEEEQEQPKDEFSQLKEEVGKLNDKYLRLFSEFDNYKKRTAKEKATIISQAGSDVLKDILPVVDDLERALEANKKIESDDETVESLKQGFELIHHKLLTVLESKGVKPMDSKGEEFNTDYHEAMTRMPAPSEDMKGKVVEVVEKGYWLKDSVLRYAKVVVGE